LKVLVSRLTGKALNYAAALADGYTAEWLMRNGESVPDYVGNGQHALRLLSDYDIDVLRSTLGSVGWTARMHRLYSLDVGGEMTKYFSQRGLTPGEAIARCFVAFKLGSEVEIPDKFL
jgi:hypothetical protein